MTDKTRKNIHPLNRAARNMAWLFLGKLFIALARFFSIPLILGHYGKVNYGLVILAMALSGYMNIANLALPTGMIKHAAAWLGTGRIDKLSNASRSSFVFYSGVGLLNFLVFVLLALFGLHLFNVPLDKLRDLQQIFIIAAIATLFTWPFSLVEQLLSGAEELSWLAKTEMLQEFARLSVIITAIWMDISIVWFFLLYVTASKFAIPLNLMKWRSYVPLLQSFKPGWYWKDFKEVLVFSIGLLVIALSVTSAMQLRPIVLAVRATDGVSTVAEYQIIFGITSILIVLNGVIRTSILPVASKVYANGDWKLIESILFKVTKYAWSFLALILFGTMMISDRLLTVYVGYQYADLAPWLIVWLSAFLFLYLGPAASVVMGTGKIKLLMLSSPTAAVISIALAWVLSPKLNVGAVAISTLAYYGFQFLIYHIYYLPRVLKASSIRMLRQSFLPPVIAGLLMVIAGRGLATVLFPKNPYFWILVASTTGLSVYVLYILLFSIRPPELIDVYGKIRLGKASIQ
ncbi:MAG: hypothetical protein DRH50_05795 [Deltaproteobacteria bacterium]|nr:MAG: hypothetical protein DRH50_05795 [Deltaproteobacteria bacterium]